MGFGVGICWKCGFIDYDFNLYSCVDDENSPDYDTIICQNKQLCPRPNQNIEINEYVYRKYISPNIRYISRRCNTKLLFDTIDWLVNNIEKENTEPEKFQNAIEILKKCSY